MKTSRSPGRSCDGRLGGVVVARPFRSRPYALSVKRFIDFLGACVGAAPAVVFVFVFVAGSAVSLGSVSFDANDLIRHAQAVAPPVLYCAGSYLVGGWLVAFYKRDPMMGGRSGIALLFAFVIGGAAYLLRLIHDAAGAQTVDDWAGAGWLAHLLAMVGAICLVLSVASIPVGAWRRRVRPCPLCREKIRPGAVKCAHCRALLPAAMTGGLTVACPECAVTIYSDAKKCGHCGYRHDGAHGIGSLRQESVLELAYSAPIDQRPPAYDAAAQGFDSD